MHQLPALVLSLAVETPICLLTMRHFRSSFTWRLVIVAMTVTLISHPFAWAANTIWLRDWSFMNRAILIETAVVIFEAVLYRRLIPLGAHYALLLSLIANLTSFGIGLLTWSMMR